MPPFLSRVIKSFAEADSERGRRRRGKRKGEGTVKERDMGRFTVWRVLLRLRREPLPRGLKTFCITLHVGSCSRNRQSACLSVCVCVCMCLHGTWYTPHGKHMLQATSRLLAFSASLSHTNLVFISLSREISRPFRFVESRSNTRRAHLGLCVCTCVCICACVCFAHSLRHNLM